MGEEYSHNLKLYPITLFDCIALPIGRMTHVKFEKETSIQRTRRIIRDRIIAGNPSKTPFPCIVGTDTVKTKNRWSVLLIMAAVSSWIAGMDGIEWFGAAGGGPVVKTGSVDIESPDI
jgi:hypothetical protein